MTRLVVAGQMEDVNHNPDSVQLARIRKLRYRAWHRGILEADYILGHFADRLLDYLSKDETDAFACVLNYPDPDLMHLCLKDSDAPFPEDMPENERKVCSRLRDFARRSFRRFHD